MSIIRKLLQRNDRDMPKWKLEPNASGSYALYRWDAFWREYRLADVLVHDEADARRIIANLERPTIEL